MSKIEIILLDSSNASKGKINIVKPNTLKELYSQLRQNFKNEVGFYEIFYLDENKETIKIYSNEDYKRVKNKLYVREVESKCFKQSSSDNNKNKNLLKDSNIDIIENNEIEHKELTEKYKTYIAKTIIMFKNVINEIKSIHNLLNLNNNIKLNTLAKNYPLSFENLEIDEVSNVIEEELELIKNYLLNTIKMNVFNSIIKTNQLINNYFTRPKIHVINNGKTIMQNNLMYFYKSELTLKYYTKQKGNYNIFGAEFVENNKNNIDLIINSERHILINNIELLEGKNTIIMLIKNQLSNLSHMFSWCNFLIDINDLKDLDVKDVKDFSYMFCGCSSIIDLTPLQNWNVSNGINFSGMFLNCWNLSDLTPIKNWNVSKGNNFQYMFYGCSSLSNINPIKIWKVPEDSNISNIFQDCAPSLFERKNINFKRKKIL